jgi:hypothetical protein
MSMRSDICGLASALFQCFALCGIYTKIYGKIKKNL